MLIPLRRSFVAGLVLVAVGTSGCSGSGSEAKGERESVPLAESLSFVYDRGEEPGLMPQTMVVLNESGAPVVIEADLEVRDSSGGALAAANATSVYGFERGEVVLMPGENLDVLQFAGVGTEDVHDVRVTNVVARAVDVEDAALYVEAKPVDAQGVELDYARRYAASEIVLPNKNSVAVRVQVVAIIWQNDTLPEASQQPEAVVKIGEPITVPAGESGVVRLSESDVRALRATAGKNALSIKTYFAA